jgi:hypothetical protein
MGAGTGGGLPRDLARAQSQVQAWRGRRQPGERIPRRLWTLAVGLVHRHGVSRTAMALGLDYYTLKQRAEESASASSGQAARATFVELPSSLMAGKQGLFELDNGAGASMRVQLVGYDAADLEALARSFWNAD